MKAAKIEPPMPPNPAPYLTNWLFEIGPTMAVGMGEDRLSLRCIADELGAIGVKPLPWEIRLLRRLSGDFLTSRELAKRPDCPPPYGKIEEIMDRGNVSRKLRMMVAGGKVRRVKRSQMDSGKAKR